jgi:mannose-6-phosphate isomerase-like protein (cupin superfamily)
MARQGDVIENPRRKERVRLLETTAENGGTRLVLAVSAETCEVSPPMHMHPRQTESFHIEAGRLTYVLGASEPRTAGPGDEVVVVPGQPHTWWNAGPETLEMVGRLEPAGRFQTFMETIYGLIRDGKVTSRGIPNPLQMAVIAHEFRNDVVFTGIPRLARRLALPIAASIGRLRGYRPSYSAYSDPETTPVVTAALLAGGEEGRSPARIR